MMRSFIYALTALTAVAACEPVAAPDTRPDTENSCGAEGYQGLIGQPRTVLDGMSFPLGTRVIGPDDAVTADYRAERLNIEYGRNGRIERINCY